MRFSILGPVEVTGDDGAPLAVSQRSLRSTLAVLLLHEHRPPSRAQLIDALWGDHPPGDAEMALRVRIRQLRRALAGHDRLVTHDCGYWIVLEPGELDLGSFTDLAARGRAALDKGNPVQAARLLGQACQLWRDPPLCDVPDTPALTATRMALLDQRRDAQEWLVDARLALGRHHEVLGQIRALIAADPLTEHAHVQLMLALYRCGQKAAALAAYGRLREVTVREFGQDPGPEARELLGQILADAAALRLRAAPPTLSRCRISQPVGCRRSRRVAPARSGWIRSS